MLTSVCALLATACAPVYTPPTAWTYDDPKTEGEFRPDLTACVETSDPDHLYEMYNGGDYQASGWFVDTARTQAVVSCMEAKGWDAEGPDWYEGPAR